MASVTKRGVKWYAMWRGAELRPMEVRPATAGQFADRLDKLLVARERVLSPQTLNHLRAAVFGMFERATRSTGRGQGRTRFAG